MRASLISSKLIYARFCTQKGLVSLNYNADQKTAFIKMTNPKKRNTLSLNALNTLKDTFTQVQKSVSQKKTKIVILQSEGTVFSSGHDLKELNSVKDPQVIFDACAELMKQIRLFPSPVICVVNGIAAAAGFQMAMACDIIVASQKSSFSCPGVKWGLFCSTPGIELVRSISSQKKANQLLLFGQQFSAKDAQRYGIVNKVVPEEKLTQTVNQYIKKANNLSGETLQFGKKILWQQRVQGYDKAYQIASKAMSENIKTIGDCQQGLKAFSQKRHPKFKN